MLELHKPSFIQQRKTLFYSKTNYVNLMEYTYANSPGYGANLSVSRTVHQIPWIKASLGIFSTKDEKSSEFYLEIKKNIVFSC